MPRPPRLQLTGRSIVVAAAIVAGVVVAAWIAARSTRVLGWVAAAVVLAALLLPVVEALAKRMRRGFALALVLVASFAVVNGIVWASIGDLRHGLDRLRMAAPEAAQRVEASRSWIGDAARQFDLQKRVQGFLDDLPARLAGGSGAAAVRSAATRGVAILITVVLTVFLIGHGPRLVRGFLRQIPDDDQRRALSTVLLLAYRRAWGYVTAIIGKAAVVGLLTYALCRGLELPASSILALTAGVGSTVPYLGIMLGGLPLVLLAGGVHDGRAAAVALLGVLTLQGVDGVVTAGVIQPRTVRVGPAVSLATVLLGTSLYGIGGAAVGLPIAVLVVAIADEGRPDTGRAPAPAPEREPERALP